MKVKPCKFCRVKLTRKINHAVKTFLMEDWLIKEIEPREYEDIPYYECPKCLGRYTVKEVKGGKD